MCIMRRNDTQGSVPANPEVRASKFNIDVVGLRHVLQISKSTVRPQSCDLRNSEQLFKQTFQYGINRNLMLQALFMLCRKTVAHYLTVLHGVLRVEPQLIR